MLLQGGALRRMLVLGARRLRIFHAFNRCPSTMEDIMRFDFGATSSQAVRRFTLYLPERDRDGNAVTNIEYWVGEACFLLCLINGGVTRLSPAEGIWFREDTGVMIREPLHIVYSAVKPERFIAQIGFIRRFIERFGRDTNQDAVAAEFDGRIYFFHIDHAAVLAVS